MSEMLTQEDLAQQLQVPLETIWYWRKKGTGPSAIKLGRHVRYRVEDVERWIEDQRAAQMAAGRRS